MTAVTVAVRGRRSMSAISPNDGARSEVRDGLAVLLDRQLALLDDEEHEAAFPFEGDLVPGGEATFAELVGEALEIPLVEVGEEADVTKECWSRLRHGAIHTPTGVPLSRHGVAAGASSSIRSSAPCRRSTHAL